MKLINKNNTYLTIYKKLGFKDSKLLSAVEMVLKMHINELQKEVKGPGRILMPTMLIKTRRPDRKKIR